MAQNFVVTDNFAFNAQSFDFAAVYARAFDAYDSGIMSNYSVVSFSTERATSRTENFDRSILNSNGTTTVVHVEINSGSTVNTGSYSGSYFTSIKENQGAQLLYSLNDVAIR